MNLDSDTQNKIQELQILEHNSENLRSQRQALEVELNEINNALSEVKASSGEVYKVLGGAMIKSDKQSIAKDLEEKKKILSIKLKAFENQEKIIDDKREKLQKHINDAVTKTKK